MCSVYLWLPTRLKVLVYFQPMLTYLLNFDVIYIMLCMFICTDLYENSLITVISGQRSNINQLVCKQVSYLTFALKMDMRL